MSKEEVTTKYVPIQMFIRFAKKESEANERAMLVARAEDGSEYTFLYENIEFESNLADLVVSDFINASPLE